MGESQFSTGHWQTGLRKRLKRVMRQHRLSLDALGRLGWEHPPEGATIETHLMQRGVEYLARLHHSGIDVHYLLTGETAVVAEADEALLIHRWRSATPEAREAAMAALGCRRAAAPPFAYGAITADSIGQVVQGDSHVAGDQTFNVGTQKR